MYMYFIDVIYIQPPLSILSPYLVMMSFNLSTIVTETPGYTLLEFGGIPHSKFL